MLLISKTLRYPSCACVRNILKIVTFVTGKVKLVSFSLFLDALSLEILSTVILLSSAGSFKKGCCQLQAKVWAEVLVNCLFKLAKEKVWLGELTVRP